MTMDERNIEELNSAPAALEWQISVPIFKNSLILRQLGLAIGIPFGILILILAIVSLHEPEARYGLYLLAALFLLTALFIAVVYRGKYDVEYRLDGKGIHARTQNKQAKKNRVVNLTAIALGLASGKPGTAGAGILAAAKQAQYQSWEGIDKIDTNPGNHIIRVRGGVGQWIVLFCKEANYRAVEQFVRDMIEKAAASVEEK